MFLGVDVLRMLLSHAGTDPAKQSFAMLCLAAYAFLLRVPSEALPIQWHGDSPPPEGEGQAVLTLANGIAYLRLRRRKNKSVALFAAQPPRLRVRAAGPAEVVSSAVAGAAPTQPPAQYTCCAAGSNNSLAGPCHGDVGPRAPSCAVCASCWPSCV
jgi:hypothetical protein